MTDTNLFGPLLNLAVGPSRAIEEFLRRWLDTYMVDVEADAGLNPHTYARPQSWVRVNLLQGLPGEDLSPTLLIVNRGANGRTERQSGTYNVPLAIGIAVVTSSYEGDGAREVAGAIGAAAVGALLHRRNIDGAMNGRLRVESWDDVRLDDVAGEDARTRAICRLEFTIRLNNVVNLRGGPDVPDPEHDEDEPGDHEPPAPLPTVLTHIETLTKEDST